MTDRAVTTGPPVGVVVALVLGTAVAAVGLGAMPATPAVAGATLSVDGSRLTLTHRAGEPVDVRRLDVVVRVDGTPLRHQPPIPFFATRGFESGPTGPFNAAADPTWDVGERASLRVATTNRPALVAGARVTIELRYDGRRLTTLSATA